MLTNEHALTIVESTINLANNLGLTTVIEGVKNQQQFEKLIELGCPQAQGYHF